MRDAVDLDLFRGDQFPQPAMRTPRAAHRSIVYRSRAVQITLPRIVSTDVSGFALHERTARAYGSTVVSSQRSSSRRSHPARKGSRWRNQGRGCRDGVRSPPHECARRPASRLRERRLRAAVLHELQRARQSLAAAAISDPPRPPTARIVSAPTRCHRCKTVSRRRISWSSES